jgi:transmembrane sensor
MDEKDIRRILDAYLEGKATPAEKQLLDRFFQDHADAVSGEKINAREFAILENTIRTGIEKRILPARHKPYRFAWVAAAVITLAMVASWFILYLQTDTNAPVPVVTMLEKTTTKGQKLTIRLPDGSTVKLNSGSRLTFPETFANGSREVVLSGEGYFDVVHNPSHPFVVKTSHASTTVLGTSFNVNDRPGKGAQITLVNGRVEVATADTLSSVRLQPNQRAVITHEGGRIDTATVNVLRFIEWKDNVLAFEKTALSEVVLQLEDWYGVDIELQSKALEDCRITARYESESLENVLESFKFMLKGSYTLEGKKVKISGKGCRIR